MNNKSILVVTTQHTNNSLNEWTSIAHPYHVNVVDNDEKAIEWCHLQQFDLVVVDTTDALIDAKKLGAVLSILQEDATVFRYEGESIDALSENIEAIFNAKKYKRILNMILLEPSADRKWDHVPFSLN